MSLDQYTTPLIKAGAKMFEHSGRSLYDHLLGTAHCLQRWGNPLTISLAGLYHSVYGTEDYHRQLFSLSKRSELQRLIGDKAEQLAYLFSAIDRRNFLCTDLNNPVFKDNFLNKWVCISTSELIQLMEIEAANLLDQATNFPKVLSSVPKLKAYIDFLLKHISANAKQEINAFLGTGYSI